MKNKSKNKFIFVFIIGLLILILLSISIVLMVTNSNDNKNKDKGHLTIKDEKVIDFCIDKAKCDIQSSVYSDIVYNGKSTKLKSAIDKINKDTEKYYQKMINSDMNDESCAAVRDKYQYSQGTITYYSQYENEKFISVTVQRIEKNVCTKKGKAFQVETIVYDKEADKLLNQKEFKKKLNVQDEDIYNSIKDTLTNLNNIEGGNFHYKIENEYNDVVVFYSNGGILIASFYQPDVEAYMTAEVKKQ